jgi:parallel beta-helix repeat protein
MMKNKLVCLLLVAFLMVPLIGFSQANFFPPPPSLVHVYIRSNGTVDPASLPVERVGETYTFNADLANFTLEVQRSNIIVDGAGHLLDGGGIGQGLVLANLTNVVFKDLSLVNFREGTNVASCTNITFHGLTISGCELGFEMYHSFDNSIENCNITANDGTGVVLFDGSKNNSITDNQICANGNGGINLQSPDSAWNRTACDGNTIARNNLTADAVYGVWVLGASNCRIAYNNISQSSWGIHFSMSTSQNNTLTANTIVNCEYGLLLVGGFNNSTISANTLAKNGVGIENDRTENNQFYNNNLIDNRRQAINNFEDVTPYPNMSAPIPSINVWFDNSSRRGNYWSNYTGTDNNTDGIADVPFIIDLNNTDPYPLMKPYGSITDYTLPNASPSPAATPSPSPTNQPTPAVESQSIPSVSIEATFALAATAAIVAVAIVLVFRRRKASIKRP